MNGQANIHASTVAWNGRAVVILGPSGSGKSALSLQLMAWGCDLVADDRTILTRDGDALVATCPIALRGLIEARGIGIIPAPCLASATVALTVDLGQMSQDRLPVSRTRSWAGITVPLLHNIAQGHFPAAILQYLKAAELRP